MSDKLSKFLDSGIYRFEDLNAVFIDPVRILNRSYTRFRVAPSAYYTRFFESKHAGQESGVSSSNLRKRKRKEKEPHSLNEREKAAEQRHQVTTNSCSSGSTEMQSEKLFAIAIVNVQLFDVGNHKHGTQICEMCLLLESHRHA